MTSQLERYSILVFLLASCVSRNYLPESTAQIRLSDDENFLSFNLKDLQIDYYENSIFKFGAPYVFYKSKFVPIVVTPGDKFVFVISGTYHDIDYYGNSTSILLLIEVPQCKLNDTINIGSDSVKKIIYFISENLAFERGFDTQLEGELIFNKQESNRFYGTIIISCNVYNYPILLDRTKSYCSFSSTIEFAARRKKLNHKPKIIGAIPEDLIE